MREGEFVASKLLSKEVSRRGQKVISRLRDLMDGVDMAFYDRNAPVGFVYSNLGELLRKVQGVGATSKPVIGLGNTHLASRPKLDSLNQLKRNMLKLEELQNRLDFMLTEIEGGFKRSR